MKNYLLFYIFISISFSANGQNLLANPSFEYINYCETNIACSPAAWYSVSNVPFGYENDLEVSTDGKHSLAFLIASGEGIRSYWQTPILCNLEKGREYSVSFDINPINGEFNPDFIGIRFMEKLLRSKKDTLIKLGKNQYLQTEKIANLKNGWVRTSTIFTASGDEIIFLIGNFNSLSNEDLLKSVPSYQKFIGYYIDNVSLRPTDNNIQNCAESTKRRDSLFEENSRHIKVAKTPKIFSTNEPGISRSTSINDTLILGAINFNFDSDELLNTSDLNDYFKAIDPNEITGIHIIGYTDSIGTKSYNLELSERRAVSVKNYLVEVLKLPEHSITTIGKGISRDKEKLEKNRRVELIVSKTYSTTK